MDTFYTIHKQILNTEEADTGGYLSLVMPVRSEILTVQVQDDKMCIWYRFNEENSVVLKKRLFRLIPTGCSDRRLHKYIATCILKNNDVYHIFEVYQPTLGE